MAINYNRTYKIGELLMEYGAITEEELDAAIEEQERTGTKLGEILISRGIVAKRQINELLEYQLGIPFVDLAEIEVDEKATALLNETIARKYKLIPIKVTDNELSVAMEDPTNLYALDDVRIYSGMKIMPLLADDEQVMRAIEIHYGKEHANIAAEQFRLEHAGESIQDLDAEDMTDPVKSAPVVKLVNTVLEQSVHYRASDIHIEPYDKNIRVRYRVDGKLKEVFTYDKALLNAIVARIKISAGMDISDRRKPQDGRFSITASKKAYDVRVSTIPTVHGEKVVMRVNSKTDFDIGKESLGFYPDDMKKFNEILSNPFGIILVSGPTGSGKSTTLYTSIKEINNEEINIVTVEDPVESQINGINQVQVNAKAGVTFASALRSILRQDPDVIMIGEIRDSETAEIAVKASITGHLVVSTIHTNDAPSSVTRLIDMGIEPYLISASLVGVIAQRLVRRLCPKCSEEYEAAEQDKMILGVPRDKPLKLRRAIGCHMCNNTGYTGRMGVFEIMPVTNDIIHAISTDPTIENLKATAINSGTKTLKENAARRVLDGETTVDELLRIAYSNE